MDDIRNIILDNIRTVSRLEQYPTHKLRVIHQQSCVPEILHESRYLPSITRRISQDSRIGVLVAIEQTIRFLRDDSIMNDEFQTDIQQYKERFNKGMSALQLRYEEDMHVTTTIERIMADWEKYTKN